MKKGIGKFMAVLLSLMMIVTICQVTVLAEAITNSVTVGYGGSYLFRNTSNMPTTNISITNQNNLGGKSDEDSSQAFVYDNDVALEKEVYWRWSGLKPVIDWTVTKGKAYVAMNVYVSGGAKARIGYVKNGAATVLMVVDSDGTVYVDQNGTLTQTTYKLKIGRWNRIAFSINDGNNSDRWFYYIDGKKLMNGATHHYSGGGVSQNAIGDFMFGIDKGSEKGIVAYDDVVCSNESFYKDAAAADAKEVTYSENLSTDFAIDTNNKIIYYADMNSANDLLSAISNGTTSKSARIYKDGTFSELAETLNNETNIAVLENTNGYRFDYYTFKDYCELPKADVNITTGQYTFSANAEIFKVDEPLKMYLASYTSDHELINLKVVDISDAGYNVSKESGNLAYGSGYAYVKVFLWTSNLAPVGYKYEQRQLPVSN